VPIGDGSVTFLDTPGHVAFEKMRERGANIADMAILVVDAERGVQAQTLTSINYIKAFDIPTIVALNKMDKASARPNKTRNQLIEAGLNLETENGGGEVPTVKISALHEHGIQELKETLMLLSGLNNFKADRMGPVEVTILESRVDKNLGVITSGIVRCGTLKPGTFLLAGIVYAKVRWIYDSTGNSIKVALPGYPIEFTGFSDKEALPNPGDIAIEPASEKEGQKIIHTRLNINQMKFRNNAQLVSQEKKIEEEEEEELTRLYALENGLDEDEEIQKLRESREQKSLKGVPLMIKADVIGSIEAIKGLIDSLPKDELDVHVVRSGIGNIIESDIKQSDNGSTKLVILGFDVKVTDQARLLAENTGVIVHTFKVVYHLMDWLRAYCTKKLPPEIVLIDIATCLIQEVFEIKLKGKKVRIAGCIVVNGTVKRGADVQVRREGSNEVLYTGKIRQLRHIKQDVKSVPSGKECGIMLTDNFGDFESGDRIYCVEKEEKPRQFDPQS